MKGTQPFSEPETKGVSDFLFHNRQSIVCYINFQSYGQLWMSPFGWTIIKPNNYSIQVIFLKGLFYIKRAWTSCSSV